MSSAERERVEFFRLGFHYYITGRFAASAHLSPVTGNLFHYAIERFLKGGLSKKLSEAQRKRVSHNLVDLWSAFKLEFDGHDLSQFDPLISELHKFEKIRFPETIIKSGMTAIIGFGPIYPPDDTQSEPYYNLSVPEIDSLVRAIFDACNLNPKFYAAGLNRTALKYLRRRNRKKATRLW